MKNYKRLIRIFYSLILFPQFCYHMMLILVIYFTRLVDLTDLTYPESTHVDTWWINYNPGHNILELYNILVQI